MIRGQEYRRGDLFLADLEPHFGSEQGGTRPVVVLQNNIGNIYCPTVIVAPITSRCWKKPRQPTHCVLQDTEGLCEEVMVLAEQIRTLDKARLRQYLGHLTDDQMQSVNDAVISSLGLEIPWAVEAP